MANLLKGLNKKVMAIGLAIAVPLGAGTGFIYDYLSHHNLPSYSEKSEKNQEEQFVFERSAKIYRDKKCIRVQFAGERDSIENAVILDSNGTALETLVNNGKTAEKIIKNPLFVSEYEPKTRTYYDNLDPNYEVYSGTINPYMSGMTLQVRYRDGKTLTAHLKNDSISPSISPTSSISPTTCSTMPASDSQKGI